MCGRMAAPCWWRHRSESFFDQLRLYKQERFLSYQGDRNEHRPDRFAGRPDRSRHGLLLADRAGDVLRAGRQRRLLRLRLLRLLNNDQPFATESARPPAKHWRPGALAWAALVRWCSVGVSIQRQSLCVLNQDPVLFHLRCRRHPLEGVQGDENPLGLPPEEGRKGGESKEPRIEMRTHKP